MDGGGVPVIGFDNGGVADCRLSGAEQHLQGVPETEGHRVGRKPFRCRYCPSSPFARALARSLVAWRLAVLTFLSGCLTLPLAGGGERRRWVWYCCSGELYGVSVGTGAGGVVAVGAVLVGSVVVDWVGWAAMTAGMVAVT